MQMHKPLAGVRNRLQEYVVKRTMLPMNFDMGKFVIG